MTRLTRRVAGRAGLGRSVVARTEGVHRRDRDTRRKVVRRLLARLLGAPQRIVRVTSVGRLRVDKRAVEIVEDKRVPSVARKGGDWGDISPSRRRRGLAAARNQRRDDTDDGV